MVAYYARFVKYKTKKPKRGCKNATDGVQYGMFRIRPWRNWISQWIPIPKAGGSNPSGRAKNGKHSMLAVFTSSLLPLHFSLIFFK